MNTHESRTRPREVPRTNDNDNDDNDFNFLEKVGSEATASGTLSSAPAKQVLSPTGTQSFSCQEFQELIRLCSSDMYVPLED